MSKKAASAASKRAGRSLHIGLNAVARAHYGGWSGRLAACEFDANDMAAIARSRGIRPKVLLTKAATRAKVLAGIRSAATRLKKGDLFLLTYSGHGGQLPDVTSEEKDGRDETWCLYDGELIDDELYLRPEPVRHRSPHPRALRQLPQRYRDAGPDNGGLRRKDTVAHDAARGRRCDL